MFIRRLAMLLIFAPLTCFAYGQSINDTAHKRGFIIYDNSLLSHFAVLMQDTSISGGNRFDYWFYLATIKDYTFRGVNYELPAFIVDSALFKRCEERLKKNDSSVSLSNYSKDNLRKDLKKFVHLLIGYVDPIGRLNVVVQFVTLREYKKKEYIYNNQVWLLTGQKNLRFAIIVFDRGEY